MNWATLQESIATCDQCVSRWGARVAKPLRLGEIPEPPPSTRVLFVGVAPTPIEGESKGNHFWSPNDGLRRELCKILRAAAVLRDSSDASEERSNFTKAGFFFVHAAKVRPIHDLSPPHACIRHCATQHLAAEIEIIHPRAICFLGKKNASVAAAELFGVPSDGTCHAATLRSWRGMVAVAPQPIRGNQKRAAEVITHLLRRTNP